MTVAISSAELGISVNCPQEKKTTRSFVVLATATSSRYSDATSAFLIRVRVCVMVNVYTVLTGAALVAVVLLALVRRIVVRSSPGADLMNVFVSRQWLAQHQSHDR